MAPTQALEERIAEFRSDPHKMEITTKFVDDVIAQAKAEAMNRTKESEKAKLADSGIGECRQNIQANQGTLGKEEDGTRGLEDSSPAYSLHFASATQRPKFKCSSLQTGANLLLAVFSSKVEMEIQNGFYRPRKSTDLPKRLKNRDLIRELQLNNI